MTIGDIACTYASLILHDDGISITEDKISTLLKVANVNVEPYWAALFAKLLAKMTVVDLITNVGSGGGGAAVAVSAPAAGGAASTPATAPVVDEKKEDPKEESDDDMGFSLFD